MYTALFECVGKRRSVRSQVACWTGFKSNVWSPKFFFFPKWIKLNIISLWEIKRANSLTSQNVELFILQQQQHSHGKRASERDLSAFRRYSSSWQIAECFCVWTNVRLATPSRANEQFAKLSSRLKKKRFNYSASFFTFRLLQQQQKQLSPVLLSKQAGRQAGAREQNRLDYFG